MKKFLNNVVAIDDKLSFVKLTNTYPESDDDFDSNEDESGLGAVNTQTATPAQLRQKVVSHQLDYQDLSLSFAEYGINCSGFIPDAQRFNSPEQAAIKNYGKRKACRYNNS
ncbi:hypothetical protein DZS_12840 [Dickeya ananatis]